MVTQLKSGLVKYLDWCHANSNGAPRLGRIFCWVSLDAYGMNDIFIRMLWLLQLLRRHIARGYVFLDKTVSTVSLDTYYDPLQITKDRDGGLQPYCFDRDFMRLWLICNYIQGHQQHRGFIIQLLKT